MNRKGQGAKGPTTNVADESPWSGWDATRSFLKTSKIIRTVGVWRSGPLILWLAASLVNKKTVWQECAATGFTGQQLSLRTLERSLIRCLKVVEPTAAERLWFGGFWSPQVLGQLAVFNMPLLQALRLMNGK